MHKKIKVSLSFFSIIWMLFAGEVGHSKSHLFLLPPPSPGPPSQLSQTARVRPDFENIFFEPGINSINY